MCAALTKYSLYEIVLSSGVHQCVGWNVNYHLLALKIFDKHSERINCYTVVIEGITSICTKLQSLSVEKMLLYYTLGSISCPLHPFDIDIFKTNYVNNYWVCIFIDNLCG